MAKEPFFTYPIDTPHIEGPGLMHRETDFLGSDKHIAVEPEHETRAAKGDLGFAAGSAPDPKPLTKAAAMPWKGLTGTTPDPKLRGRGPWKGG